MYCTLLQSLYSIVKLLHGFILVHIYITMVDLRITKRMIEFNTISFQIVFSYLYVNLIVGFSKALITLHFLLHPNYDIWMNYRPFIFYISFSVHSYSSCMLPSRLHHELFE